MGAESLGGKEPGVHSLACKTGWKRLFLPIEKVCPLHVPEEKKSGRKMTMFKIFQGKSSQ